MLTDREIFDKIKKVVEAPSKYTFGINLGMYTRFADLEVDSMSAIVFVADCEYEFGVTFNNESEIIGKIMKDSNYTIGGFVQDVKGEIASKKTGILQNLHSFITEKLHSAVTRRCK